MTVASSINPQSQQNEANNEQSNDQSKDQSDDKNDARNGLFVWTSDRLKAATQAVHGQWLNSDINNGTDNQGADNQGNDDQYGKVALPFHIKATRIITDTRKLQAGDIFLAIVGENFDGHDFIEVAAKKGAVAAIVSKTPSHIHSKKPSKANSKTPSKTNAINNLPLLKVDDTRLALGHLAAYRRRQHPNLKVIAITGSSGKTTVKEMLRSIFIAAEQPQNDNQAQTNKSHYDQQSLAGHSTLVTRGNLNNDFGVPMMLLELADQQRYAVLELGANHVGEIAYTANIVNPDVACILNIGTAHLGEFGGRDNIAKTKAEIYAALTQLGTAIVPFDDDYHDALYQMAKQATPQVVQFGWQDGNLAKLDHPKVYATDVSTTALQSRFNLCFAVPTAFNDSNITPSSNLAALTTAGETEIPISLPVTLPITLPVILPMAGSHNVSNSLAAAACAYAVGIAPSDIAEGLSQVKTSKGRLHRQPLGIHQIIDDTYNANPNSVRAAADVLSKQAGEKILVLGDIGELGDSASMEHKKLGHSIAATNIDRLMCVGEFATATVSGAQANGLAAATAFVSKDELLNKLTALLEDKTKQAQTCTLLFKGSRSATMETLIATLMETSIATLLETDSDMS